jgi:hypothetical protein
VQSTKVGESALFLKVFWLLGLAQVHMMAGFNLLLFHINNALTKMVIAKMIMARLNKVL